MQHNTNTTTTATPTTTQHSTTNSSTTSSLPATRLLRKYEATEIYPQPDFDTPPPASRAQPATYMAANMWTPYLKIHVTNSSTSCMMD